MHSQAALHHHPQENPTTPLHPQAVTRYHGDFTGEDYCEFPVQQDDNEKDDGEHYHLV
jgi:hypothetical protein